MKKRKHAKAKHSQKKTDVKNERDANPQVIRGYDVRSGMNLLLIFSGIAVAVAAMLGLFSHFKDAAIWFTWLGVVLAITAAFVWFQGIVWERDAASAPQVVPHAERASLVLRHLSLENLGSNQVPFGKIGIENLGKADAIDVEQETALIARTEKLTSDPPTLSRDNPPTKTMVPSGYAIKITATAGPLLNAAAAEAIKEGKVFVYVYGVIRYYSRHFPKDEQTLKFCSLYDPVLHDFKQTPFHNTTQ